MKNVILVLAFAFTTGMAIATVIAYTDRAVACNGSNC
jgi:hypothetical protein